MVTRNGNEFFYDDVRIGWAKNPKDDQTIFLVATDVDNEEIHAFPVPLTQLEQFFNMARQTAAGQKIEIVGANDPRAKGTKAS